MKAAHAALDGVAYRKSGYLARFSRDVGFHESESPPCESRRRAWNVDLCGFPERRKERNDFAKKARREPCRATLTTAAPTPAAIAPNLRLCSHRPHSAAGLVLLPVSRRPRSTVHRTGWPAPPLRPVFPAAPLAGQLSAGISGSLQDGRGHHIRPATDFAP
jgi:hypothetical protein